jgi:hypothetical protein
VGGDPKAFISASFTLPYRGCRSTDDSHSEGITATALTIAVTHPNVDVELVRVLISAGADVNAVGR